MIAFKNNRPLLQTGHCVISDYDEQWIASLLQDAAAEAGATLPFCHEIAAGIIGYLENSCPMHAVPLEFLFERMRRLLHQIGLPLIASHLKTQTPPVDIELDTLAGETPLPLFFYAELHRRMDSLRRLGLTTYHFSGKQACSLTLGGRRRACPAQRAALQELNWQVDAAAKASRES